MTTDKLVAGEHLAELMDETDSLLDAEGIEIDESIEEPSEYVEQLTQILADVDLAEDVAEALRSGVSCMESLLGALNGKEPASETAKDPDLDESSVWHKVKRAHSSMMALSSEPGYAASDTAEDPMKHKEPGSVFKASMDKQARKATSIKKVAPVPAEAPAKKTAAEAVALVTAELQALIAEAEPKKWIQKAIKKPGALHKSLGVPQGKKIPGEKLAQAASKPGKLGRRARLAVTLKHLSK